MRAVFLAGLALTLAGCGSDTDTVEESATMDAQLATGEDGDDAQAETPEVKAAAATMEAFPAAYRGLWDERQDNSFYCSDMSDTLMRIEEDEIGFYESVFEPAEITETGASEISAKGTLSGIDVEQSETYGLKLQSGGERLVFSGSYGETTFQKCSGMRDIAVISPQFQGTWAPSGTCDPDRDDLITIESTTITWNGKTSTFTKAENLDRNAVELEDDGQDTPYGITLRDGGERGMLIGPGHSGIPLTRCSG